MGQSVEEEKHYVHNQRWASPSLFLDVKDVKLRDTNRGSILANIFERYVTKDTVGRSQLLPKDFSLMARELDRYVEKVPKKERGSARDAMMDHLHKRGYNES